MKKLALGAIAAGALVAATAVPANARQRGIFSVSLRRTIAATRLTDTRL